MSTPTTPSSPSSTPTTTTTSATAKPKKRPNLEGRLTLMSTNIEGLLTARGITSFPVGTTVYTPASIKAKVDTYLAPFLARDTSKTTFRQKTAALKAVEKSTSEFANQVDHGILAFIAKTDPDVAKVGMTVASTKARKPSVKRGLKSTVVKQNKQAMLAANQAVLKSSGDFTYNSVTGQVTPPADPSSDATDASAVPASSTDTSAAPAAPASKS